MARKCFDHEQFNFEFQVALGVVQLRSWRYRRDAVAQPIA